VAEILRQTEHPKAKTARPEDFVDLTLVKGLAEAGFFSQR